jgi:hypothetical protein
LSGAGQGRDSRPFYSEYFGFLDEMRIWYVIMLNELRIGTGGYKTGAYKPD